MGEFSDIREIFGVWREKIKMERGMRCLYLELCAGDCPKNRLYDLSNQGARSWLCEGKKIFYSHTLSHFRQLAEIVQRNRERETMFRQKI